DLPGAVTITLGSGLMIFGVSQAESHGWSSVVCWGSITAGSLLVVAFLRIEQRADQPLLPFRVLRRRGSVALFPLVMIAVLSNAIVYLTSLFLQDVLHYSAGEAGGAVLGLPAGFGIGVNISAWLVDRLGLRRQAVVGFALIGLSCIWLARSPDHASLLTSVIPGTFGGGLGLGITLVVLITTVTAGVAQDDQGIVAGVYGMSQQLGGAVGLAVLASIAASGGAVAAGDALRSAAREAHAIRAAFVVSAGLALATVCIVVCTLPSEIDDGDDQRTHDLALSPFPGEMTIPD
ncbi:MAG: transrane efflux protein, partial [Ilumatobacteraceae bacterium]|nr:transrane efflux protein [Ilumatobacteraceae bacterium]